MNIKTILCPHDFSNFSEAANEYASVMAKATDAKIIYLHVTHPDIPHSAYAYIDFDREQKVALEELEKVKPTIKGVPAEYQVKFGLPSDEIVNFASERGVDLIVLGTHGRTGLKRALLGSVAEVVVRKSQCPVLAVKADSKVLTAHE
jgi:nucleotide-binding universal stress UspA family protein